MAVSFRSATAVWLLLLLLQQERLAGLASFVSRGGLVARDTPLALELQTADAPLLEHRRHG